MTAIEDPTVISRAVAENLELEFLGGLEDAQFAYERIVETEAWKLLDFATFADWWAQRVQPVMRALSMRPTREIAASVVERVREEEAELPPAQRRTQRELAEMVGVGKDTVGRLIGSRSAPDANASRADLDEVAPRSTPGEESRRDDLSPAVNDGEPPLPGMPAGQERADAFMAGIDATETLEHDEAQATRAMVRDALNRHVPDPEAPRRQWQIAFLDALRPAFRLMAQFSAEQVATSADDECLDELARLADQLTSYRDRVRAARPIPDNVRHLRAVS